MAPSSLRARGSSKPRISSSDASPPDAIGRFRPAFDGHLAVARIEADRDPARVFLRRFFHQRRIAYGRRADNDAVDALAEPAFDRRHVAHAAAELHRNADDFEDTLDRSGVDRLAGKGAVEIDHMQI